MHRKIREFFVAQLAPLPVLTFGSRPEFQGTTGAHLDSAVLDLLLLSHTGGLILARSSTFGYVAHGLAGRPATIYGTSHVNIVSFNGTTVIGRCDTIPTSEATFHRQSHAVQGKNAPSCRAGHENATGRGSGNILYWLSSVPH